MQLGQAGRNGATCEVIALENTMNASMYTIMTSMTPGIVPNRFDKDLSKNHQDLATHRTIAHNCMQYERVEDA